MRDVVIVMLVLTVALLSVGLTAQVTREDLDALATRVDRLTSRVTLLEIRVKALERDETDPVPANATRGARRTLDVGQVITLTRDVPLAADEEALAEYRRLAHARDIDGQIIMTIQGRLSLLAPGTQVRIIEHHGIIDRRTDVRVTAGPLRGLSGTTMTAFLE